MFDSWAHQYCLVCDKQVQVDNDVYCSESCRLAEFEKTSPSTPSSRSVTPGMTPVAQSSWGPASSKPAARFYLSPAYDFSNAQPYGSTPSQAAYFSRHYSMSVEPTTSTLPTRSLSPSSSHSSLCSMQSNTSTNDANRLSDKARKELRAYAVSFEHVRMQRRRSY